MKVIDGIVPPATKSMLSDPSFLPCYGTPFGLYRGIVYHRERPITETHAACFEIMELLTPHNKESQVL